MVKNISSPTYSVFVFCRYHFGELCRVFTVLYFCNMLPHLCTYSVVNAPFTKVRGEGFECQLATDVDDDKNTNKQILWLKGKALITAGAVADGH